jgi:DNA-binding protein Fis
MTNRTQISKVKTHYFLIVDGHDPYDLGELTFEEAERELIDYNEIARNNGERIAELMTVENVESEFETFQNAKYYDEE